MSFLDNLENDLKALESRAEVDPKALERERAEREAAKKIAIQIAPHAETLRRGPFTDQLLVACRTISHRTRVLIRPTWVDTTLRLEAGGKKLELRPTPKGVIAVVFKNGVEQPAKPVNLAGDPVALAEEWFADAKRPD